MGHNQIKQHSETKRKVTEGLKVFVPVSLFQSKSPLHHNEAVDWHHFIFIQSMFGSSLTRSLTPCHAVAFPAKSLVRMNPWQQLAFTV